MSSTQQRASTGAGLCSTARGPRASNADLARLTWIVPNPTVRFVDADDDVCNVGDLWRALPDAELVQEIPLIQLDGRQPISLGFSAGGQWTSDPDRD